MRAITGLVLSGGQGRRMGGVDKGLSPLHGRPMVAWVIERVAPQVSELLISANQNLERYGVFGYPVLKDEIANYAGPLAGLHAGMKAAHQPYVLMVPCDSPFLPADLGARLYAALDAAGSDLAVAKTGAQSHPVFALAKTTLLPQLSAFLEAGGRTVYAWYDRLRVTEVGFDGEEHAFSNINTTEELNAFESTP